MKLTLKNALVGLTTALVVTSALARPGHQPGKNDNGPSFGPGHGGHHGGYGTKMERLVLEMRDSVLTGNSDIGLKQEIKKQFPRFDLRSFELDTVEIVAKSRFGRGQVQLLVGNMDSFRHQIDGDPRDFDYDRPFTFDSIKINNPAYDSEGRWRLMFNGNIKLRKIIVELKEDNDSGFNRLRFTEADRIRFDKIYTETQSVRVTDSDVLALKLEVGRTDLRITEVEVLFRNGERQFLSELEGVIFDGDSKEVRFDRARDLRGLRITAVARKTQFGGGGVLTVSVGKRR